MPLGAERLGGAGGKAGRVKTAKIQRLDIPPGRRVLAVSDVHGNRAFLEALLNQVGFCHDDLLILLGDFVEKRAGGLETLRYVMDLTAQGNVVPLIGNCDDLTVGFVDQDTDVPPAFYDWYLERWGERCLLVEMGNAAGVTVRSPDDHAALRSAIKARFGPELDFLRSLPNIALSDRFLFVHGGVPCEDGLEQLEAWRCMKNDAFLTQDSPAFRRWCVVGHWPVMLYDPKVAFMGPLLDPARRVISIDGGCSLKLDGQLNALIIPPDGSDQFTYQSYDGLPLALAQDAQAPSVDSVNIRWGRNKLKILRQGGEFTRCLHLETGREIEILTEFLYHQEGETRCEDSTDYLLPVSPGDVLSIVRETSRGLLAKKNGTSGWYLGHWSRLGGPNARKGPENALKTWKKP